MAQQPPFYNQVRELAMRIVEASESKNRKQEWQGYQRLSALCQQAEQEKVLHPFLWETLADFTPDHSQALRIYSKALSLAESASLDEYQASIRLAMAERLSENNEADAAWDMLKKADFYACKTDDNELKREISEMMLEFSDTNV